MSGGYWEYKNDYLQSEMFNYCYADDIPNVFEDRELSEFIYDALDLIHDFDLYKSGDSSEESWLKNKTKFKSKWLGKDTKSRKERTKRIIDKTILDAKQELYKTYGIEDEEEKK